ncbi:Short chain fatty acids transporter [Micrococcus lylae]|uniref:Short chain fatty acids transporter n=2 Tax=Micrococcus lylae TaxID=1273 RepID=A0A1R4IJC0_9MICC|nr:Short chain fatty acids transporter [Micrococcus lylae]
MPTSAPARSDAQTPAEGNVFSRAMRPVNTVVERFIPSSLMFTIVLTFLVAILCLTLTPAGPLEVLDGWGGGLAGLLEFMTQMALVLLLGHILANTGPVRRLLS